MQSILTPPRFAGRLWSQVFGKRLGAQSVAAGAAKDRPILVARAVTVRLPRADVYTFWRNFENLPRFFHHVESIRASGNRWRWRASTGAENPLEWEAEVIVDVPGECIEWQSVENGAIKSSGTVRFLDAPGNRGTEVRIELEYEPRGPISAALTALFGRISVEQMANDLRRFKQIMETGEVVHSDASIRPGKHPARPEPRDFISEVPS